MIDEEKTLPPANVARTSSNYAEKNVVNPDSFVYNEEYDKFLMKTMRYLAWATNLGLYSIDLYFDNIHDMENIIQLIYYLRELKYCIINYKFNFDNHSASIQFSWG